MAKTLVIDLEEGTQAPFLRGILTRSLQDSGLSFEDAYRLASRVRQDLGSIPEITVAELRRRVAAYLQECHGAEAVRRYQDPAGRAAVVLVRDGAEQAVPFSDALYRRTLQVCGLSDETAAVMAARVSRFLSERAGGEVSSATLGRTTYHWLARDLGEAVARRYLAWVDFLHSGRPLVILLGGTAGVGKSTVATDLATRLDIPRTQSTDMLREVMRMMLPQRLLPVLYASSFEAWRTLPRAQDPAADRGALLVEGYQSQADLIALPCEAVIRRALRERVSLIMEGVHVCPSVISRVPAEGDVVVVPVMLAVRKPDLLRARIRGRAARAVQRRAERYLRSFESIWGLQEFLLSEADRQQIPIVENEDKDRAVQAVLTRVVDTLMIGFRATPRHVFGSPDAPRKRA